MGTRERLGEGGGRVATAPGQLETVRNHLPGGPLGGQTVFISDFWPPEGWGDKHLLFEALELGVICYSRSRKPMYQRKWWCLRG